MGRYESQFSGATQQDSQEFLEYLLEGLHSSLNKPDQETDQNQSLQDNNATDKV